MTEYHDVIVVGAGLTGLSAARTLAKHQIDYLVLEQNSHVGGRLQTNNKMGCALDQGFQVILPAYPSVAELNLPIKFSRFSRAATCLTPKGKSVVSDPIHHLGLYLANLFTSPASINDSVKLLQHLRSRRMDLTTSGLIDELKYSRPFQSAFLRPFLSGVLLDPSLNAPSPMSSYFLERFFLGGAALVPDGIQQFAKALSNGLKINLENSVASITGQEIITQNGKSYAAKVIIDTRPSQMKDVNWLSTECHYLLSCKPIQLHRQIHLCDTSLSTSINHFANLSEVEPTYSPSGTALLSVTVKPGSSTSPQQVQKDVVDLLEIPVGQLTHIETRIVTQALPETRSLTTSFPEAPNPEIHQGRILASDALAYGSQHAALRIGQGAAMTAIRA